MSNSDNVKMTPQQHNDFIKSLSMSILKTAQEYGIPVIIAVPGSVYVNNVDNSARELLGDIDKILNTN